MKHTAMKRKDLLEASTWKNVTHIMLAEKHPIHIRVCFHSYKKFKIYAKLT